MTLDSAFYPQDPERNRFLTGVFSLFVTDVIHCWCTDSHAPYSSLGKATLRPADAARGAPLDFAFQDRRKKQTFAVIMQGLPGHDTPLRGPQQIIELEGSRTFAAFLDAAANPARYTLAAGSAEYPAAGAILIWGSLESKKVRASIRKHYPFADILSIEDMIRSLLEWQNRDFQMLLDRRAAWCYDFFRGLRQLK